MRLKNKRTGEIIEFDAILPVKDVAGDSVAHLEYGSLAELNSEWEDAPEEPKGYWYIDDVGVIQIDQVLSSVINMRKSIGNYFSSREEAELALRKLKAVKRLKDKGFSFHGYDDGYKHDFNSGHIEFYVKNDGDVLNDLDLLFGGEE